MTTSSYISLWQGDITKEMPRGGVVPSDREASVQYQGEATAQIPTGVREVYQR